MDIFIAIIGFVIIGIVAGKLNLISEKLYSQINDVVYYITLPVLIFAKLAYAQISREYLQVIWVNALSIFASIAIALIIWKAFALDRKTAGALLLCIFFGNIVYLGFPVVEANYGSQSLPIAAAISATYNLIIFSAGILILGMILGKSSGEFARDKLIKNTVILSCILGAFFSYFSLSGMIPGFGKESLTLIGSLTSPLALFAMGVFLSKNAIKNFKKAAALSAAKLLIFPIIMLLTIGAMGLGGMGAKISLLESMMPLAVTNFILAKKFGLDEGLVASTIVISTGLFAIMLPFYPFIEKALLN